MTNRLRVGFLLLASPRLSVVHRRCCSNSIHIHEVDLASNEIVYLRRLMLDGLHLLLHAFLTAHRFVNRALVLRLLILADFFGARASLLLQSKRLLLGLLGDELFLLHMLLIAFDFR